MATDLTDGTVQQIIELLAVGEMTQSDIAASVGLSPGRISQLKKDEGVMKAVVKRSRELLREELPQVYRSLAKHSKAGNDKHMKIYLDHLERLEQIKANQLQISFSWTPPCSVESTVTEEVEEQDED